MTPELHAAILDRINRGYSKEQIQSELSANGYTKEAIEVFYEAVKNQSEAPTGGPLASLYSTPFGVKTLPSVAAFFNETWSLASSKLPLFGKAVIFGLVLAFLTGAVLIATVVLVPQHFWAVYLGGVVISVLLVCALVVSFSMALMRALLLRARGESFMPHLLWSLRNIVWLTLPTVYVVAITQLGYMLLFIPGIMATVYLLVVTPVLVSGRARGFLALTESTALVYGYFWPVVGRFILLNLSAFIVYFLLLGIALTAVFLPDVAAIGLLLFLAVPLFFFSIFWLICGLVVLFESLLKVERVSLPLRPDSLTLIYKIAFFVVFAAILLGVIALLSLLLYYFS